MNLSDDKIITVVVPSRGTKMPVTVTAVTTLTELLRAAGCPDWYVPSLTRRGPAIALADRRLIDAVHNKGRLYLSPPITSQQLPLPFRISADPSDGLGATSLHISTRDMLTPSRRAEPTGSTAVPPDCETPGHLLSGALDNSSKKGA